MVRNSVDLDNLGGYVECACLDLNDECPNKEMSACSRKHDVCVLDRSSRRYSLLPRFPRCVFLGGQRLSNILEERLSKSNRAASELDLTIRLA